MSALIESVCNTMSWLWIRTPICKTSRYLRCLLSAWEYVSGGALETPILAPPAEVARILPWRWESRMRALHGAGGSSLRSWNAIGRRILPLLLVLTSLTLAIANGKNPDSEEGRKSRTVLLTASPMFCYATLNVQLVATLTGVDPQDRNFCHAGITWIRVDPGASPENETRMSENPRCVHGEDEIRVATT